MAAGLLRNPSNDVDQIKYACGSLYNAGADTTFSAVKTVALCLLSHPKYQERLHSELDTVLGSPDHLSRLPSFEELVIASSSQSLHLIFRILVWKRCLISMLSSKKRYGGTSVRRSGTFCTQLNTEHPRQWHQPVFHMLQLKTQFSKARYSPVSVLINSGLTRIHLHRLHNS